MTRTARARCKTKPDIRADGLPPPIAFGHEVTAEHSESRDSAQKLPYRAGLLLVLGSVKALQRFMHPSTKPGGMYTNNSLEFNKACEDLAWTHDTSHLIAVRRMYCRESSPPSQSRKARQQRCTTWVYR